MGQTSKAVRIPSTTTSHLFFNCHAKLMRRQMKRECISKLNTWSSIDRPIEDLAHCNQLMAFEGLAKANSLTTQRTWVMNSRKRLVVIWEFSWWSWMKSLAKSLRSKAFWRRWKAMLEGPLVKRLEMPMKVNLKESKNNFKSPSSWKAIKELG